MIGSLSGTFGGGTQIGVAASTENSEKLKQAASDFESLLLSQILKSMRESSPGGWLGDEEDQSGSIMIEVAEQQFARAMSACGGFGLAEMTISGIEKNQTQKSAIEK